MVVVGMEGKKYNSANNNGSSNNIENIDVDEYIK